MWMVVWYRVRVEAGRPMEGYGQGPRDVNSLSQCLNSWKVR